MRHFRRQIEPSKDERCRAEEAINGRLSQLQRGPSHNQTFDRQLRKFFLIENGNICSNSTTEITEVVFRQTFATQAKHSEMFKKTKLS
jgi:hypothetical protein